MLKTGARIGIGDVTLALAPPPDSPLRDRDPERALFAAEARLLWTEAVLPGLRNSLLVGARIA